MNQFNMLKLNNKHIIFLLIIANILLFLSNMIWGSISIPLDYFINYLKGNAENNIVFKTILEQSRFPQTITAIIVGASLSVAGLLMQTLFKNPLAGPGILGISSGASLGVAFITLLGGASSGFILTSIFSELNILFAASLGSFLSLFVILFFANFVRNNISLLIIGIMMGYISSSLIGFLQFISHEHQLHSFVVWGLGSFSNVSLHQLPILIVSGTVGILASFMFVKTLNLFLLGENYAANLGVDIKKTRYQLIAIAGLLTAVSTAYAGPIAFIGLAIPHLSRMMSMESDHKILLPIIVLNGMAIAMLCNLISRLPGFEQALPINTITSLFGAPLVVYFLVKNNKNRFNI